MTTTVAIMAVEIDLTDTDLATAMTAILIQIPIQIPEIHASFARNQTVVPGSICQRSKRQKRLDLGLKTSINLVLRPETPVTSIHTS
jgi:hypothetical protein